MLGACASEEASSTGPHHWLTPEQVTQRCLAYVATPGFAAPAETTLSAPQWRRYVACKIESNLRARSSKLTGDPVAVVTIRVAPDGAITSVTLAGTSGSDEWDQAARRAIDAVLPLPAVPPSLRVSRIDMHFRPAKIDPIALKDGASASDGAGAGTGLTGESHWSVQHCNTVGGATACN
ncbi:energy transducer TonB [Paraburkholderia acidipaludis]|uniref:energy transducer TonB n=1 Tax=Paraburkholderia acidipaludis TaxID=660537 RepID=UPI00146FA71E|nr:energy transducer TonB [Paraburkholderia acidipaludis]